MAAYEGAPSDDLPAVLAAGRTDVTTIFVSMAARHPAGLDADYIAWHSLDHRPEQHRLASLRGSLRLVSTPAGRAARVVSEAPYDGVDHVMTYLFADPVGLKAFRALGGALAEGGRMPLRLPSIQQAVYRVEGRVAAPRVLAGADVVPWRPAAGVFLLVERGTAPAADLAEVPGVAGVWWYARVAPDRRPAVDHDDEQLTYCYLDDDPCATAARLEGALRARWARHGVTPLLAAPFHTIVPYEWDRHLP